MRWLAALASPLLVAGLASCTQPIHKDFLSKIGAAAPGRDNWVNSMRYHEEAQLFAIGYESGSISIWDVAKASRRLNWSAHKNRAKWLAFTPDGRMLYSSSPFDESGSLWSTQTGQRLQTIPGLRGPATATADSKYLVLATSSGIRLYDIKNKALLAAEYRADGVPQSVASSSSGGHVAVGTASGTITLWAVKGKSGAPELVPVRTINPYLSGNWIMGLQFSKEGNALSSVSRSGVLDTWEVPSLERKQSVESALKHVSDVVFRPDGLAAILSGADDRAGLRQGLVQAINLVGPGTHVRKAKRHMVLEFIPPLKRVVASGDDQVITVFDLELNPK